MRSSALPLTSEYAVKPYASSQSSCQELTLKMRPPSRHSYAVFHGWISGLEWMIRKLFSVLWLVFVCSSRKTLLNNARTAQRTFAGRFLRAALGAAFARYWSPPVRRDTRDIRADPGRVPTAVQRSRPADASFRAPSVQSRSDRPSPVPHPMSGVPRSQSARLQ